MTRRWFVVLVIALVAAAAVTVGVATQRDDSQA
jgi:hypothetical protein